VRYAIFGDIHGNYDALETVLADIKEQGVDRHVCMGDVVGYGAEPVRCLDAIREIGCQTIAGNHDWAAIERISIDFFNAYAKAAAIWTREALSDEDKAWLGELPLTLTFDDCSMAHGTFHQPEAYNYIQTVFDAQLSFEALRNMGSTIGFLGHSHVPVGFFDTDPITYTLDQDITAEDGTSMIVNVGSVGQPRDENPKACWCLYDTETKSISLRRLEYDIDAAAAKIREAGLPEILAQRLYHGK
jgi:diadenosine tetraphosphatase ApaH/serine/threonine PP2A family protein phosphatase